ncbi:MAG: hypothetical protein VYD25_06185 [Pseudomonadota bacterium]|nr:hypothetical protein [Pseudomonadota bacterium]MEE3288268.1 hypothetical protein [Pseudomonadota bacterium]
MNRLPAIRMARKLLLLLLAISACSVIIFIVVNLFYGLLGGLWTPAA